MPAKEKTKSIVPTNDKALVETTAQIGATAVPIEMAIAQATNIAKNLKKVIADQNLYTLVGGKAHVHAEGWETLGALVGIMAKESEKGVVKIPGGYQAHIDLIRISDGKVIGGASAICTTDEKNWASREPYALYSMALTRATGKAFRLALSWVMKLAGYEVTPWEEMQGFVVEGEYAEEAEEEFQEAVQEAVAELEELKDTKAYSWPLEDVERLETSLVKNGLLKEGVHRKHTIMYLNLTPFGPSVPLKELLGWSRKYREYRKEHEPKEAARRANEDWFEGNPAP